jgi:serine/threonine protein kinase
MVEQSTDEQAIFEAARQLNSAEDRQSCLQQLCGENAELRLRVEALLRAYDESESFLESPPTALGSSPTALLNISEKPGTIIGPYKLLQQIGEGGMGVVYMAEQTEPVSRRVALKIIKPGMDTRQVIARFEAERQALAMMDHPNISKVFGAGATDTGRPYFVMELVKGIPITEYCDEHQLSPRERLELFLPACQAVQHAHQKGIIHRDIKPSNVMVADYDDRPVPKIIDFGVAKAVEQRLTEKTLFTEFGQVVGTMEYMSPEQAKLNQQDVDRAKENPAG